MKKALITGANKSIGFETARQLLQKGYFVYLGARNLENGNSAVKILHEEGLHEVQAIRIDVADASSINAARTTIGNSTDVLDVLINNAGISGGMPPQTALGTDMDIFREVFDVNFFGVVMVTQAFIDLMKKSAEPRIVNVTSGLGSLTLHSDPAWKSYHINTAVYSSSKAALNMYTIALAYELRETVFKVNVVDPGYTATDFNGHSGPGSVEDAAARLVKAATIAGDGPSGKFFSDDNAPETGISPW